LDGDKAREINSDGSEAEGEGQQESVYLIAVKVEMTKEREWKNEDCNTDD
jgi:hypothetical protein